MPNKSLIGLTNKNNLCYLNATFIFLLSSKNFKHFLQKNRQLKINILIHIFNDYLEVCHQGERSTYSLSTFRHALIQKWPEYSKGSQMDSQEVMLRILEFIEKDYFNDIKRLFNIGSESTIHCYQCGKSKTLTDSMRFLTSTNLFDIDKILNKNIERIPDLICDFCEIKGFCETQNIVSDPKPKILVINIHRYHNINPVELQKEYFVGKNKKSKEIKKIYGNNYVLKGVIIHHGDQYFGHYECLRYCNAYDIWKLVSDTNVKDIDNETAMRLIIENGVQLLYDYVNFGTHYNVIKK